MSEQDATGDRNRSADATNSVGPANAAEQTVPADPAEKWMYRDDEFLLEADREYVLRDDGRSWRSYVWPLVFGVLLAVMVGDVITTGVGMAMGFEDRNPVVGVVVAEVGLAGLLVLKTAAAILLVALPDLTGDARQTARAGGATYFLIGAVVVTANVWAILAVA